LIRTDSATVANVWSRNTTTNSSDTDASSVASGASNPSTGRRSPMMRVAARAPTSSGATAIRPCGASVTENTAMTMPTA
jgi:hypothetical protein